MVIKNEWPPNIEEIRKVFDSTDKKPVFCWGDILYNPHNCDIVNHILVHEEVHSRQQISPEAWWKRYLEEPEFRLSQELEAYSAQYKFAKKVIKDRNLLSKFLNALAYDISGKMYGNMIEYQEAIKIIKE